MKTLVDMERVLMNLDNNAEVLGKMNIDNYVLIDLKRKIKEDFVFFMKAKTAELNVLRT